MAVSVETLIADTRVTSGLRNNRLFSDDQLASILTDGYADLRDRLIVRFAGWFREEYPFTLSNGEGNNVLDLSLVPDFQMAQGLDLLNNGSPPFTVPMLDSFAERNQYNNLWPLGVGWSYNGFLGRRYWIDGDTLTVYPSQNASGNYNLIYTPMLEPFALHVNRTFNIDAADTDPTGPLPPLAGPGFWSFANGGFNEVQFDGSYTTDIPVDGSAYLDTNFSAGPPDNTSFNSRWFINGVSESASNIISVSVAPSGTVTGPAAGTATVNYQPIGTIGELPQPLTPWAKYLVLYASLVIRASRQQQTQDLELQFQQMQQRVTAATKQRSEGIRQAPITRGWGGSGFGGGGWR